MKRYLVVPMIVLWGTLVVACSDNDAVDCDNDGLCDPGETTQNCPADCPVCVEDGVCDTSAGENTLNCPADCTQVECDLSETGDEYEFLVSEVYLPDDAQAAAQVGVDLDGNGIIDNKLGTVISMLAQTSPTYDVNQEVNSGIQAGEVLLVGRLRVDQFPTDEVVVVQLFKGAIHDASPIFDGSDQLEIHADSALDDYLCGDLADGALRAGPNAARVPFPLPGMGLLMYDLQEAQLVGSVTASGWTSIILGGGVPEEQIDTELFPALLTWMNQVIQDDPTGDLAQGMISLLDGFCDSSIPGCESVIPGQGECDNTANPPVITDTEIRCNQLMVEALAPDVDLDGDTVPDVISVGMRLETAVPVTIFP